MKYAMTNCSVVFQNMQTLLTVGSKYIDYMYLSMNSVIRTQTLTVLKYGSIFKMIEYDQIGWVKENIHIYDCQSKIYM